LEPTSDGKDYIFVPISERKIANVVYNKLVKIHQENTILELFSKKLNAMLCNECQKFLVFIIYLYQNTSLTLGTIRVSQVVVLNEVM